ncbi:MAG TPA: xanthine dehydrogenase family protein molybdopterin-binding subunit [Methylomirabilota bacterium]|nr:xanthine dehydrogenase family protein molybdopterin-binding subunit [Methylomirabilota bacterium]
MTGRSDLPAARSVTAPTGTPAGYNPGMSIGQPLRRKEDGRLLRGQGRFTDDFSLPGQAYAAMVRSPHPHARIVTIDAESARTMPGVLAVFTGADVLADGLGAIPHNPVPSNRYDLKLRAPNGGSIFFGPHVLLPADRARHVGEAVAMVVAETRAQAADAAEAVRVTWEPLPFVVDTAEAAEGRAPAVWDEVPTNVCVDCAFGSDEAAVDAAFARAAHVVAREFHVGRVTGAPIEPRAALGAYDPTTGRYVLYAGSGGAVRQRREIAEVLGLPPERLRVVSLDVGGNFGTKNRVYVESGLVLWAARKLGRPVKYTATRAETLVSDYQGRDLVTRVKLALDADGRFLAFSADNVSNVGARAVSFSPLGKGSALVTGNYDIPVARVRSRAVFTHTVPTQAYRSSGRPEVTYAIERLIDLAAAQTGIDRIELRRRNLIDAGRMPYTNPFGMVYDSGRYAENMALAMRLADWDGFAKRRAEAEARGQLLGRGLANYVESSVGTPREQARLTARPEGVVDVVIGTQSAGQGHETSFAQVAAERLELDVAAIRIVLGDTDVVRAGGGTHSGRSMRMAGTVIALAAEDLIAEGKREAAQAMEAAEADVRYARGRFTVAGTDRGIGLFELPDGLTVTRDNEMHEPVFPNGCHVCEVEVDPETGAVRLARYAAVDDVGRAVNPMIVEGQTHGGIVQGLGQALGEACVVDPATGQTLTGSLMDYALPRAGDLPSFPTLLNEVPSPTNPLGVKAGGEGGTTPAPAVVASAIADALAPLGVAHIPMPASSAAIWAAIRRARAIPPDGPRLRRA